MDLDAVIAFFDANRASPKDLAGMARYGIKTDNAYGVRIPVLRALAKRVGRNHALAPELWATGIHDARNLAPMIDDPAQVTRAQMNRWARDFDSWDICDNCCNNLFRKTTLAHDAAVAWAGDERAFVRCTGFTLMAVLAVHDKGAPDR
jgi:3-methyladenine DNA glycosylase AlkD